MNTHVSKLFKSNFGPASNLWLEGQRLVDAGFPVGTEYSQFWYKDRLVLSTAIVDETIDVTAVKKTVRKKVLQSGGNANIRIEGKRVVDTFPGCVEVSIEYTPGKITITGHSPQGIPDSAIPQGVHRHSESVAA